MTEVKQRKADLLSKIMTGSGSRTVEDALFNISTFTISLFCILLAVTTSFLGLSHIHIFTEFIFGVINGILYYFSRFKNKPCLTLFIILLYVFLSIIWFTGVGSNGFAGLFFLVGVVLSITIFRGIKRYVFSFLALIFVSVLVGVEFFNPGLVNDYCSFNAKYIDYFINVQLFLIGLGFFTKVLVDTLRKRTEELEKSNEKLKRSALYDELTGVPNRRLFYVQLKNAINVARRSKKNFTLLYLDLDDFKKVNDECGHNVGDIFLKLLAERVSGCLRKSDIIARLGGDEFAIILPEIGKEESIIVVAQKILVAIGPNFTINGKILPVRVSIGASIYRCDGTDADAETLVSQADKAMYKAKKSKEKVCEINRINE